MDIKKTYTTRIGSVFIGVAAFFFVLSATVEKAHAAITSQLAFGSTGSQVTELQQFLATDPSIYPEGIVSGYFGSLTKAAVIRFQALYGIPQVGQVGPVTRAKINQLESSGSVGLDVTAPSMSAVSVQPSRNSVTLTWIANEPVKGQVYYDIQPIQSNEATGPNQTPFVSGTLATNSDVSNTSQIVIIQNLQHDTTYYYLVRSIDTSGNITMTLPSSFKTTI